MNRQMLLYFLLLFFWGVLVSREYLLGNNQNSSFNSHSDVLDQKIYTASLRQFKPSHVPTPQEQITGLNRMSEYHYKTHHVIVVGWAREAVRAARGYLDNQNPVWGQLIASSPTKLYQKILHFMHNILRRLTSTTKELKLTKKRIFCNEAKAFVETTFPSIW